MAQDRAQVAYNHIVDTDDGKQDQRTLILRACRLTAAYPHNAEYIASALYDALLVSWVAQGRIAT